MRWARASIERIENRLTHILFETGLNRFECETLPTQKYDCSKLSSIERKAFDKIFDAVYYIIRKRETCKIFLGDPTIYPVV